MRSEQHAEAAATLAIDIVRSDPVQIQRYLVALYVFQTIDTGTV